MFCLLFHYDILIIHGIIFPFTTSEQYKMALFTHGTSLQNIQSA